MNKFKNTLIKYVMLAGALVLAAPMAVAAHSSYVTSRMQALSEEDVENFANMTNRQNISADLFSRPFTDEEKSRMISIRKEYNQGSFPKENLQIRPDETADLEFYYNSDTGMFFLPESRELTDEELRQYVDFCYVRDYSLQMQHSSEDLMTGETADKTAVVNADLADGHEEIIKKWIKIFGISDMDSIALELKKITSFDESEDQYIYEYEDLRGIFTFTIENNQVMCISLDENETVETDKSNIDTEAPLKETENYVRIKESLSELGGNDTISAWYSYQVDANGELLKDMYTYMLEENDNESGWLVFYHYGREYPYIIWKITPSEYFDNIERGKALYEQTGIRQEVTALNAETGERLSQD